MARTSDAAIASWNCGRRVQGVGRRRALVGFSAPSKRRNAASIAASRAAGRGGGGSGKDTDSGSDDISTDS